MRAYALFHGKVSATVAMMCVVVAAFAIGAPRSAHAQNLVQDPNFLNGFTDYQTQGDVFTAEGPGGNVAVVFATDTQGPNPSDFNGAFSQVLNTTPGLTYTISFLMNFDPQPSLDSVLVSFGSTNFPITLQGSQADPTFDPFSFTATATDTQTTLTFLAQNGAFATNGLDVEGAPAPPIGGGLASFCLMAAGFVCRRFRRISTAA